MLTNPRLAIPCLLLALAVPCAGQAQGTLRPLPRVSSETDDLLRLDRLAGVDTSLPYTLRAPSRLLAWDTLAAFTPLAPFVVLGSNSALPEGGNDGALWQGRGRNAAISAGLVAQYGGLRVILAPELVSSQNLEYQVVPYRQDLTPMRSVWANPFHPAPFGIDLPSRHGDARVLHLDAGQSSLTVRGRGIEGGISTENAWWGPGVRNALLLGANAPGVPSAFLRSSAPVRTRTGTWDSWLAVGWLSESAFFDSDPSNDARTMSALALTWRPPHTHAVELGAARVVITAGGPGLESVVAPLRSVGRPNGPDSLDTGDADQVASFWARWAQPGSWFEGWVEWARFEEPASLRDLLESPGHSQGYMLGLQWLRPAGAARIRFAAEATYLEPSSSIRLRPVGTTYVSRSVVQGFTHRGQMLGASIGPGASSQWIGADWLHARWRAGAYVSRTRWDNSVLFTSVVPRDKREDVSLTGGIRAAGTWGPVRVTAEWARTLRLNYLYQAFLVDTATGRTEGIDILNNHLAVTVSTPLLPAR